MARPPCPLCGEREHHSPTCPEMFWPDGRRRGENPNAPPAPRFNLERAREIPASTESPLMAEMGRIFAGVTERMITEHIERMRKEHS